MSHKLFVIVPKQIDPYMNAREPHILSVKRECVR